MSAILRLIHRSGSARVLLLIALLALASGTVFTLASLRPQSEPVDRAAYDLLMTSRVREWDDLLDWFYDQQEQMARIIPPDLEELIQPGTPDILVLDSEPLQKKLASSKPAWLNSVPVWVLELQESISGEITIRDGAGNLIHTFPAPPDYQIPYEALFRQSMNAYTPELNRYKLRSRISLLPQEFVEPYLYVQAEIEAYARQQTEPEMQMMMSGGEDELAISGMQRVTNGLRLTVSYPASFSGQVWSVYQQNTPACISTNMSGGSGGGTPPPPDGTNGVPCTNCVSCSVDLTNSFNGLESAWALCFNNLILTGETSTSWTDIQPMGSDTNGNPVHRFYGVGSNTDPDNDELYSGFELFVSHTDETDADSDDDGLSDGWEVANGLNPNDGAGANGSSGDVDSDGLSNAEEQEAGTDPRVSNPVHEVGPEEAVFEYRSAEVARSKPGFVNFVTDTDGVVRCYLEFESYGEVSSPYSMGDHGIWSCSRSVDPVTGKTPMPGDTGAYEGERSGGQWWNSALNVDYQSTGTWWLASLHEDSQGSIPESFAWLGSCDADDPLDADGADFYDSFFYTIDTYWRSEVAVTIQPVYRAGYDLGYSREDFLSDEYTTAMLTNHAWMMLADAPALTNLAWGTGWVRRITRTYAWQVLTQNTYYASAQTAATYRLPPNEAECGLARTGYRLRIPTQSGVVSRVRVVEWFAAEDEASTMNQMSMMSEGSVPPVARTSRVAVVLGNGGTQVVERSYFVIDPPTNKGVVYVGLLSVASVEIVDAPPEGLVVENGDDVTFAAHIMPSDFMPPVDEPKWYYQKLNADGSWGSWQNFGANAEGTQYVYQVTESGIFRVKTVLTVGGVACEKIYERTTDDSHSTLKEGDPDAFGVVDNAIQLAVRDEALGHLGSAYYSVAGTLPAWRDPFGLFDGQNKCNVFVADVCEGSGADVDPPAAGVYLGGPPSANNWAGMPDVNDPGAPYPIPDWTLLSGNDSPQPGRVCASGYEIGSPGHVGIVDYDGQWISAGPTNVNRKAEFTSYGRHYQSGASTPAGQRSYSN